VLAIAQAYGWKTATFGNTVKIVRGKEGYKTIPDKDAVGFPDLVLVRGHMIIFAELKLDGKKYKLTETQKEWLEALRRVSCKNMIVATWRPADITAVEHILKPVKLRRASAL
jgi:hypothetical protein